MTGSSAPNLAVAFLEALRDLHSGEERDSAGVPLSPLECWCGAELRGMERCETDKALLDAEETGHDTGARQ